jgi:curli production assembly/transport component CsgE
MFIRNSIAKVIAIVLLSGSTESILAENRTVTVAEKVPPGKASSAPKREKPAVTVPEANDRDFIDTGVLEGTDVMESGLEIGGLLVDDTVTKFGHQLFDVFNRAWKPIEGAKYNIAFGERLDAIRGSLITVKLNETILFEGFLTPRDEAINELGKGLARDIRNLVRNTTNLEEEELY